jgi:hypothetical protein
MNVLQYRVKLIQKRYITSPKASKIALNLHLTKLLVLGAGSDQHFDMCRISDWFIGDDRRWRCI